MDSKLYLRMIWIVEGALLFIMCFVVLLIFPSRMPGLEVLIPYLFGIIALQATGAIGGSHFKRLTEGFKLKAQKAAVGSDKKPCKGEMK